MSSKQRPAACHSYRSMQDITLKRKKKRKQIDVSIHRIMWRLELIKACRGGPAAHLTCMLQAMANGARDRETVSGDSLPSQGMALPVRTPSCMSSSSALPCHSEDLCVTEGQCGKIRKKAKKEKLRAASQPENGRRAADSGVQANAVPTNSSDEQTKQTKKKHKKQRQQMDAEVAADATMLDGGNVAAIAEAAQSAADRKAAKKQRRAEAKAAARAQAAALTGATAIAAPATDGNEGPDVAAGEARPAKKAKVAQKPAAANVAMAAVGSQELAMLGA